MKQEDMLKEILKQLAFVTGKLESIDNQDNQEINNFMSIQTKLFREMVHKMNGVGIFFVSNSRYKKKFSKKQKKQMDG